MTIPEFMLDPRAPKTEQEKVANAIGDFYLQQSRTKGVDQTCSDLIHNKLINLFYIVSKDIDRPLSELVKDEKTIKSWINSMFVFEAIRIAITGRFELDNEFLLDDIFQKAGSEKIPHVISTDLMAFSCWCLVHGATSETIRRNINTSSYEKTMKYERSLGNKAFVSALVRACCAYLSLGEKVMKPALEKIQKCQNDIKINSLADTIKNVKLSSTPVSTKPKHRKVFSGFVECFQKVN